MSFSRKKNLGKLSDVNLSGKGFDVHAKEESGAWNEAIDLVVDKAKSN